MSAPMVSVRAVLPIVAGLRRRGVDVAAALAEAGVPRSSLTDPDARVLHDAAIRLWRTAVTTTGDPDFGVQVAQLFEPGSLGVIEYGFRKSATVGEGVARVARYFRLNHDAARYQVERGVTRMTIEHRLPEGRALPRAAVDFVLGVAVRIIREAAARPVTPIEIRVDYARPADPTAVEALFAAPVRYATGQRLIVLAAGDAAVPLVDAEPGLIPILDRHADDLLARLPRTEGTADRVRRLIARELRGGTPSAAQVAERLGVSVRTLHRRLRDEGTSHTALLASLRAELAHSYLADRALAIGDVAFLLGYSEPSAFHRAFKRWAGQTPAAFRRAAAD